MGVYLSFGNTSDAPEPVGEVLCRGLEVTISPAVVWEMLGHGRYGEFLLEEIYLVEEEDDRLAFEPFTVYERFEEHHSFMHLVLWRLAFCHGSSFSKNGPADLQQSGPPLDTGRSRIGLP